MSFMQMAKLERLARNGSGKESLVAKCQGNKKCPREVSTASSAGAEVTTGLKSWDVCLRLVEKNLNSALANSTSKQYKYWWKRFEEFCTANGRQMEPFSDLTAAAYLSCLAEESAGIGGVDQARAALRYFHNLKFPGITSPTDSVRISSVLKGIKRRFQKPVSKKKPLESEDFSRLLAFITKNGDFNNLRLVELRFAAQISLLYCTFSRYEESAGLELNHIDEDGQDLLILFPKGKQYQYGEARMGVMTNQPQLAVNPVDVVKVYLHQLKTYPGEGEVLFPTLKCQGKQTFRLGKPASYDCVMKQFKLYAKDAGISGSPREYGLHSCRRGAVTTAVNNGCDEHTVQKQMRVASVDTVHRYASLDKRRLAKATEKLFSK